ncbi:FAD-dependent pyridine nucleotide-disulphide oxidoreductase [Methylobacterium sp. 4-46]|uniref:NAD(P)/FAD-dependent oxidoreductase n=1 Tax=unclassified Methylobacterium TaxID=2615210 RepID=UPI000152DB2D|nr:MULTISPECIES: NAD(P)/FAD-dependent oxidoreductase [Methylobacterium]ACA14596.1 FAD-dependent pyridine nucleotide-disulphide oxidoreductase [Methylobacterium sp. 4-46]WFT80351.1 NAD(P)/FAD-dependent oxidoreductase [Methylobacterium nodulans]
MYDVIIVGGGPAGLSAALVLGRCRRTVLLLDAGHPRNAVTPRMNGYLGHDGCPPGALRDQGRAELSRYPTVEVRDADVADARRDEEGFTVVLADGRREAARRLVLATGLATELPPVEGFRDFWGRGVHHCPYCDGYENRDAPVAVYGRGGCGKGLALELTAWTRDLTLCSDGPAEHLSGEDRARLARQGIRLDERPVARVEGEDGRLARIRFRDGAALPCGAMFFTPAECVPSPLVARLGCDLTPKGTVPTRDYEQSNVPGLYVAGDASRRVQFAIVAAAEGAMAAFAINTELLREDTA